MTDQAVVDREFAYAFKTQFTADMRRLVLDVTDRPDATGVRVEMTREQLAGLLVSLTRCHARMVSSPPPAEPD